VDPTIITALITAGGVVLAALFTLMGVRFTQRATRAAAERTAALERTKVDAQAYESARQTWDEHVDSLREQLADLREDAERQRRTAQELRARVDELEDGRERDRARIRELTSYARQLLRILADHEIPYPPPPPGLEQET